MLLFYFPCYELYKLFSIITYHLNGVLPIPYVQKKEIKSHDKCLNFSQSDMAGMAKRPWHIPHLNFFPIDCEQMGAIYLKNSKSWYLAIIQSKVKEGVAFIWLSSRDD